MELEIQTIVSMPFEENSYIVWQKGTHQAFVVDPGFEPEAILESLQEHDLTIVAILNTHGHADHIAGNAAMKEVFPNAPLIIGIPDAPLLTDAMLNHSLLFGLEVYSPPADKLVKQGDLVECGNIHLEVREVPGHSPGHVVYVIRTTPITVFGGDVLFRGSVGRTDFPGGSFPVLSSGIYHELYTLPDDTVVYPGHGPVTTIGHEKQTNPFVRVKDS